jgi:hypothetical protein
MTGHWSRADTSDDCDTSAISSRFTPHPADMILTDSRTPHGGAEDIARHPVLGHTRHAGQVVRRGEMQLNADSAPDVWTLVLRSPDRFAWHRSDWLAISSVAGQHAARRDHDGSPASPLSTVAPRDNLDKIRETGPPG